MLLYSHLVWGLQLEAFFASDGWNNAGLVSSLQQDTWAWSFWWYVPDNLLWPVHVGCCIVLFLFLVGAFTRVTSVLAWVVAVSYAHRAMLANFGLDQILCMLVMYLAIAPSGAYLSVDAWVRRWKAGKRVAVAPSSMATVSMRLVQVHLCIMYFAAGTSKLQGETWWNGEAVWNSLSNYEYQSLDVTFLAAFPVVTQLATHVTILWEISFAALVWNRYLRPIVLVVGLGMHFGIGLFLGMWTFGLAMGFGYVTFISGQTLRKFMHGVLRVPRAARFARVQRKDKQAIHTEIRLATFVDGVTGDHLEKSGGSYELKPSTILVTRSQSVAMKAANYLHSYRIRTYWVMNLAQARLLCPAGTSNVVVCIDRSCSLPEVQQIKQGCCGTRFVFRYSEMCDALPAGESEVVPPDATLRALRYAIVDQLPQSTASGVRRKKKKGIERESLQIAK